MRRAPVNFARVEISSEALPVPAEFGARDADRGRSHRSAAADKLAAFLNGPILGYGVARNVPDAGATSELSAELSFGIVSARERRARRVRAARPTRFC